MYIRQDGFREWGLGDRHPWVVAATSQREEYQPGFSASNMWSSLRQKKHHSKRMVCMLGRDSFNPILNQPV